MKLSRHWWVAVLLLGGLVIGQSDFAAAQTKTTAGPADLTVVHEISTTGLPLVGPIVVINSQDFHGPHLSKSMRSSVIRMGDSILSDITKVIITDLDSEKQMFVNNRNKTYCQVVFDPSNFPVIDSAQDARGPQMQIKKTGKTKLIDGRNCSEISFKLDMAYEAGVGDAKLKHYFEGSLWVTKDVPNYQVYLDYNLAALDYLRGSGYVTGGFFDILNRLDVDEYNLIRMIKAMDGLPVEGTFVAQIPSNAGSEVYETKIKLTKAAGGPFAAGYFSEPKGYTLIDVLEFNKTY